MLSRRVMNWNSKVLTTSTTAKEQDFHTTIVHTMNDSVATFQHSYLDLDYNGYIEKRKEFPCVRVARH
jgi:hypothetical protein